MHSRRIVDFYEAFRRGDAAAMQTAYARHARFRSPVFSLRGSHDVGAMWKMLCAAMASPQVSDWHLEVMDIEATATRGHGRCAVQYRMAGTGRVIRCVIDSDFVFDRDGRIHSQHDRLGFWNWARQAYGWRGIVFGWTPLARLWLRIRAYNQLIAQRQPFEATQQMPQPERGNRCGTGGADPWAFTSTVARSGAGTLLPAVAAARAK